MNIFNEILWPQFVQLNEVRSLPLNEQVNRYNQYLNELQNQRQHYTQQLNWLEGNRGGGGIKPEQPVQDLGFLLQEDGFNILQEDNNKIIIT